MFKEKELDVSMPSLNINFPQRFTINYNIIHIGVLYDPWKGEGGGGIEKGLGGGAPFGSRIPYLVSDQKLNLLG